MSEVTAGRTLVKSPPELWAVCSDADSLSQHLEGFGEIRITRLEPEAIVAWEGERVSGTVRIEPSGWGTKVTVTAAATASVAAPELTVPEPAAQAPASVVLAPGELVREPEIIRPEPEPMQRPRFLARLFGGAHAHAVQPAVAQASGREPRPVMVVREPVVSIRPEPAVQELSPADALAVLEAALDSLGQAHRRPFSR